MDSFVDKILVDLYNCIDFGFSYRAKKGLYILNMFPSSWSGYERKRIQKAAIALAKSRFIERKKISKEEFSAHLTERGKLRALNLIFRDLHKQKSWDKKWRLVAFDLPEKFKRERKALHYRLKTAGFCKLQESVFVCPYDCQKLIGKYTDLFKINKFVRFAVLDYVDNEAELIRVFGL